MAESGHGRLSSSVDGRAGLCSAPEVVGPPGWLCLVPIPDPFAADEVMMASRPGYPLPLLRPAPGATLIVLKLEWLGASRRHWSMGTPPAWAAFMDQEEKDPSIFGGGGKPAQADPARSPD